MEIKNKDTYLKNIINEAVEETVTGHDSWGDFKNSINRQIQTPNSVDSNSKFAFLYHACKSQKVESMKNVGASGFKEFFGENIGQVYGRGLYAFLNLRDAENSGIGDAVMQFAVKPGGFNNFIIFGRDIRNRVNQIGLLSEKYANETLSQNIRRLLGGVSEDMFRGYDLDRIDITSFISLMTRGEGHVRGKNYGDEFRLDKTNIDGWLFYYGREMAAVVRRMDILIPYKYKTLRDGVWHEAIDNEEQFDKLNQDFDVFGRLRGEYGDVKMNQKPVAGFILVGTQNYVNTNTNELLSPVKLKNCTSFSITKENGYNVATFELGKSSYKLYTDDNGKSVDIEIIPRNGERTFIDGGLTDFRIMAKCGIDGNTYADLKNKWGRVDLSFAEKNGIIRVGNENRGNFVSVNGDVLSQISLSRCSFSNNGNLSFSIGNNYKFGVQLSNGFDGARVFYVVNGETKEMPNGVDGFKALISKLVERSGGRLNESFMSGTFDDFKKEFDNTTTLYSRSNNLRQFATDVKSGKNIYFYTCSSSSNIDSMMKNGATYEFTGTSNDTTTFQGVVAYGSFSIIGAERNMNLGYGNTIYKFILKDDLSKYIIFDPRIRNALGLSDETLSQQVRRMCKGKKYKGRDLIDVLDYGLRHPVRYYSQNAHLIHDGVNGLDRLDNERQGDACASFFQALKGALVGGLNGAKMYDEEPVSLMGIHGYIYNGGNHWDCICVRNYNALMPVAFATSRNGSSSGLPKDENGHIKWSENKYMSQEWFDRLNDNVTARFQYGAEYPDTPLKTKQMLGFTLVRHGDKYNLMDVKNHRHLLPIDVDMATNFVMEDGIPTASFRLLNGEFKVAMYDGEPFVTKDGNTVRPEVFMALIKKLEELGKLKGTKVHSDAIYGGGGKLNEGVNKTLNRGFVGKLEDLLERNRRLKSVGETLFNSDNAESIIVKAKMNPSPKLKQQFVKLFDDQKKALMIFNGIDAATYAEYAILGTKPIGVDITENKYYKLLAQSSANIVNDRVEKMASARQTDSEKLLNQRIEAKRQREQQYISKIPEVDQNASFLDGARRICEKFADTYLKNETVYMFIKQNGQLNDTDRDNVRSLRQQLRISGYNTGKASVIKDKNNKVAFITFEIEPKTAG